MQLSIQELSGAESLRSYSHSDAPIRAHMIKNSSPVRRIHVTLARQACNSTRRISAAASMCSVTSLASTSTSNVDASLDIHS
jgi:hypothetical protein